MTRMAGPEFVKALCSLGSRYRLVGQEWLPLWVSIPVSPGYEPGEMAVSPSGPERVHP